MDADKLLAAVAKAEKFISVARYCLHNASRWSTEGIDHGKETAATRRASMELTHQLADLRKPS